MFFSLYNITRSVIINAGSQVYSLKNVNKFILHLHLNATRKHLKDILWGLFYKFCLYSQFFGKRMSLKYYHFFPLIPSVWTTFFHSFHVKTTNKMVINCIEHPIYCLMHKENKYAKFPTPMYFALDTTHTFNEALNICMRNNI